MTRKIVITGASSAIGQAIARKLAQPGDTLVLHGVKNTAACPDLSEMGVRCEVRTADFRDSAQLQTFCESLGEVDVLVNGAACTYAELLPNLEDWQVDAMLEVNVRALIQVCRAVLPAMMARRRGAIVNLSSVAAGRGNRGQSVYAGTKGFVESFTRSLAAEYGKRGVRVNAVAPGAIEAGNLMPLLDYAGDAVKQATVAGRLGSPEDVAVAVAFLCSEGAGFINGKCLAVDGGFCQGV